jgi:hypothetical protein
MREQKTGCTFGARDDTRSAKNAPDLALCGSGPRPCSARQPRLWGPIELGDRGPDEDLGRDGRASPALPGRHRGRRRCPPAQPQPGQRPGQADPGPWWAPAGHPGGLRGRLRLGWLVELLEELELEPHLVHPSRCKAIASARRKNDKVDAATLAQLLRADLLPEAWIAPSRSGSAGVAVSPGRPGPAVDLAQEPGACGAGRPWHRRRPGLVDWSWAGLAGKPGAAADPAGDHPGRRWAGGCPGHPIARREREIATLAKPDPRVQTLLARSFHILSQLKAHHRRRLVPGALAVPHEPPNTAACAD